MIEDTWGEDCLSQHQSFNESCNNAYFLKLKTSLNPKWVQVTNCIWMIWRFDVSYFLILASTLNLDHVLPPFVCLPSTMLLSEFEICSFSFVLFFPSEDPTSLWGHIWTTVAWSCFFLHWLFPTLHYYSTYLSVPEISILCPECIALPNVLHMIPHVSSPPTTAGQIRHSHL